jgi:hypothetical protein
MSDASGKAARPFKSRYDAFAATCQPPPEECAEKGEKEDGQEHGSQHEVDEHVHQPVPWLGVLFGF